jgi:hypothetical protein
MPSLESGASAPLTTRRRWLRRIGRWSLGATAVGATALGYACLIEPHWVDVVHAELPLEGLPESWHGATLVQLSDMHVGPRVSDDYLRRCFDRVSRLAPELVVLTGDLVDHRRGRVSSDQVRRVYRDLPKGSRGTFAILGNHDYGLGWRFPELADELVGEVSGLGATFLRNESVTLDGLRIVGTDDLLAKRHDLAAAIQSRRLTASPGEPGSSPSPPAAHQPLRSVASEPATVYLMHNPDGADLPGWEGRWGWILSGHTHGGQCKPPFLAPPILPVRNRLYAAGPFTLTPGLFMYVNRGLGHLFPARFNCRPEITVFRLRPA